LVVDDEPDILLGLNALLTRRGHHVKTFDKPGQALEHLKRGDASYDLLITDYRMPGGISGLDLGKQFKERTTETKVFLMTAFDVSSVPEFTGAVNSKIVDETIQKPIANDKLIAIIEKNFLHNNH
jgi:two-component system, cell cycle response regulator CpdR